MAESVDALVSNTSGATRAGSTPALGTGCCNSMDCSTFFKEDVSLHLMKKRSDKWLNLILVVLVAALAVICIRSVANEQQRQHQQQQMRDGRNN